MKLSVVFISLNVLALSSLVACGVSIQPFINLDGGILGWDNNVYKLTSFISASRVGKKLGVASYHGRLSGEFSIFQLSGSSPSKALVFETSGGQYYKAVLTTSN